MLSQHIVGRGGDFFAGARRLGCEGIVSKRLGSTCRPGRGRDWLKTKATNRQELVIGSFTTPATDGRRGHGGLLLGVYEGDLLRFVGGVGTGFDEQTIADLQRRLEPIQRPTSPFANPITGPEAQRARFVESRLVCEVELTEWTSDGRLRHPSYRGLREDREPRDVVRE